MVSLLLVEKIDLREHGSRSGRARRPSARAWNHKDTENKGEEKNGRGYATAIAGGRLNSSKGIGSNNCPSPADSSANQTWA